jgi:hypothetical protein
LLYYSCFEVKKHYVVERDKLQPPTEPNSKHRSELAAFTCFLQSATARTVLQIFGINIPSSFQLTHNSDGDDPPDFEALGLRWEHTLFPPDQIALDRVHRERGAMVVPPFSVTQGDIGKIWKHSDLYSGYPEFHSVEEIVDALENTFLGKIIGGPASKDMPVNDVLLLDNRADTSPRRDTETALHRALTKKRPKHLKLIFLVRWARLDGTSDESDVICLYQSTAGYTAGSAPNVCGDLKTGGMSE